MACQIKGKADSHPPYNQGVYYTKANRWTENERNLDAMRRLRAADLIDSEDVDAMPMMNSSTEQQPFNLRGHVGCLNWTALRTRPDTAGGASRAARLVTHQLETVSSEL